MPQPKITPKMARIAKRGRLSNYRKAIKLEEGLVVAQKRGELRFQKTKHGLELSIREHLAKLIDRIDPIEAVAVIGTTLLVKHAIDATPDVLRELQDPKWLISAIMPITAIFAIPAYLKLFERDVAKALETQLKMPEWFVWLLSFAIAYLIVKHGGQLLGLMKEGAGNLATVVKALIVAAA